VRVLVRQREATGRLKERAFFEPIAARAFFEPIAAY
jgi:hypothetical protein